MTRNRRAMWMLVSAGLAAGRAVATAHAQPDAPAKPAATNPIPTTEAEIKARDEQKARLTAEFLAAFKKYEYEAAEAVCRKLIGLDDYDYTAHYNLAACLAMQLKTEEAEQSLLAAVDRGFVELDVMARDKNLAPIRQTRTFKAILAKWPQVQERVIEVKLDATRKTLEHGGRDYTIRKDDKQRLAILSAIPESSLKLAIDEMRLVERFWETQVLPEGEKAASQDAARPDPWVMVLLPNARDFRVWATQRYGSTRIGGIYDHDQKQLVSQDTGPLLRHEYAHALHWRHMMRTGFVQPIWVQEGLCALVEDLEERPDGTIRAIPSWRTNMIRRMANSATIPKFEQFFAISPTKFIEQKGLANYAMARAIVLFLHEKGKLREWYADYVKRGRSGPDDPNGLKAMEAALGKPAAEIEKDFRRWARTVPESPEGSLNVKAILPLMAEGAGDGVRIIDISVPDAARAGLRVDDVITAVNGVPTRDLNEYARALWPLKVGEEVTVSYRRGKAEGTAKVKLWRNESR